jgi:hypothetical protein
MNHPRLHLCSLQNLHQQLCDEKGVFQLITTSLWHYIDLYLSYDIIIRTIWAAYMIMVPVYFFYRQAFVYEMSYEMQFLVCVLM